MIQSGNPVTSLFAGSNLNSQSIGYALASSDLHLSPQLPRFTTIAPPSITAAVARQNTAAFPTFSNTVHAQSGSSLDLQEINYRLQLPVSAPLSPGNQAVADAFHREMQLHRAQASQPIFVPHELDPNVTPDALRRAMEIQAKRSLNSVVQNGSPGEAFRAQLALGVNDLAESSHPMIGQLNFWHAVSDTEGSTKSRLVEGGLGLLNTVLFAKGASNPIKAAPSNSLNIVNPHFTPDGTRILQNLTNQQNAILSADLSRAAIVLSEDEMRAAAAHAGIAIAQYGNAVERLVGREIRNDAALDNLFQWNHGGSGPDFFGRGHLQGQIYDITTPGQVPAHLARPYGQDLNTIIYQRPAGFP